MENNLDQWANQATANTQSQEQQQPIPQQQLTEQQYAQYQQFYAAPNYQQPYPQRQGLLVDIESLKAWTAGVGVATTLVLLGFAFGIAYERISQLHNQYSMEDVANVG